MPDASSRAGAAAALLWALLCLRWFDVAEPWRPAVLAAVPPALLLVALAGCRSGVWLRGRWPVLRGAPLGRADAAPWAWCWRSRSSSGSRSWPGAPGLPSPPTARSRASWRCTCVDGSERLVFVPQVPYSGSLKSHLTAPLALVLDPAPRVRARLGALLPRLRRRALPARPARRRGRARRSLAGLYAAFSPAFVTRYSLSNDGNYVEVLALGTWALWLGARADARAGARRPGSPSPRACCSASASGATSWPSIHLAALALLFVAAWRGSPRWRPLAGARRRGGHRLRARLAVEPGERLAVLPLPAPGRRRAASAPARRPRPRSPASARSCG